MKLLIIMPVYNEAKSLAKVISKIPKKIKFIKKIELLIINDGSNDNSLDIAQGKADHVINHIKNRGLGTSFKEGIERAIYSNADIIVNIDSDGQFDPQEIEKVIKPISLKKADVVIGSRFLGKRTYKMPYSKYIGNKFLAWSISAITKNKFHDVTCGFRAYSREAAQSLNITDKFSYTLETLLDLSFKDFKIEEVKVNVSERTYGRSKIANSIFYYGLKSITILIRNLRDRKPFQFFGIPGLFFLFIGSACLTYLIIKLIKYGTISTHKSALTLTIFFLSLSIILFGFGLMFDFFRQMRKNQEEILYNLKSSKSKEK